jgi:hypothetical protein
LGFQALEFFANYLVAFGTNATHHSSSQASLALWGDAKKWNKFKYGVNLVWDFLVASLWLLALAL